MTTKRFGRIFPLLMLFTALLSVTLGFSGCYPKSQVYTVGNVGGLIFNVNPGNAEVLVNGVVQGRASDFTQERYLKLSNGTHRLELQAEGYETYKREIFIGSSLERIEAALIRKQ
ncbi:MAG: PEGA domain-containing protein [Syntrophorhabdaceae bacterium]|nr:PEGA domain-containing protein [Syntrophorhabdaceae bacterium]